MPAYNDTPNATDRINDTQAPIKTNFSSIATAFEINHVAINNGTDPGKHKKVDIAATLTHDAVAAGQLLLYNFVNPTTTANELYVKKVGALDTAGTPMTARGGTTEGWTYLPSGLLIRWGNNTWTGVQTVATCTAAPFYTAVYAVFMTLRANIGYNRFIYYGAAAVVAGTRVDISATGATSTGTAVATHADYLIIGV